MTDPANDVLPYEAAVDVSELIQVEEVMATKKVGPNGALVFCMEMLEANLPWLLNKIQALEGHYLIFDFPGQVMETQKDLSLGKIHFHTGVNAHANVLAHTQ